MLKVNRILASGMMFLSVAACGQNPGELARTAEGAAQPAAAKVPEGKVLVAYYSHSGNTEAVAKQIAALTGGDLFEIQTQEAYPADYHTLTEVAKKQLNEGYRPALKNKVADMDKYDVVFIGSPDWWGTYAPAVASFLAQYNWTGKKVAPFFTNGGGGMQRCQSDMQKQLGAVKLSPGVTFYGRSSGAPQRELEKWANQTLQ